jgi:hypothetical protein
MILSNLFQRKLLDTPLRIWSDLLNTETSKKIFYVSSKPFMRWYTCFKKKSRTRNLRTLRFDSRLSKRSLEVSFLQNWLEKQKQYLTSLSKMRNKSKVSKRNSCLRTMINLKSKVLWTTWSKLLKSNQK